ncbi:hypothetical protein V8G54_037527 [Vigna mungo]|uniref:Uncharacterized protein n=1 Tax=Vigna mungo TaxID=3915 RepID=A0AAQ3RE65_VIGMU
MKRIWLPVLHIKVWFFLSPINIILTAIVDDHGAITCTRGKWGAIIRIKLSSQGFLLVDDGKPCCTLLCCHFVLKAFRLSHKLPNLGYIRRHVLDDSSKNTNLPCLLEVMRFLVRWMALIFGKTNLRPPYFIPSGPPWWRNTLL